MGAAACFLAAARCRAGASTRSGVGSGRTEEAKRRILATASLALNPMRFGSGTNLKTLEYFAAGVPVVTTPIGLRGLEEFAPFAVVSELETFAEGVAAALRLPPAARADTAAARRLIEERYSWRTIAEECGRHLLAVAG